MRLVSIQNLLDRTRLAADMAKSSFVKDTEAIDRINTAITELHDLMIAAYDADYYYTTQTVSMVADQPEYTLPDDFYKLAGVDVETNFLSGDYIPARRANEEQRTFLSNSYSVIPKYFLRGRHIVITPPPPDSRKFKLHYHGISPRLVKTEFADSAVDITENTITLTDHGLRLNETVRFTTQSSLPTGLSLSTTYFIIVTDANTIQLAASIDGDAIDITDAGTGPDTILSMYDGVNGWEEYAVLDAAIYMLDKEESSSTHLVRRKDALRARLEAMTENRNAAEPVMIRDVSDGPFIYEDEVGVVNGIRWPPT